MSRKLLQPLSPLLLFARARGFKPRGGVRYPGGITYFPRFPDQPEPEYTPSKLFRVERIKPTKGNPWWLKLILKHFHIDEKERVSIVKNIPENNARLWKVKHLVKVTPIEFPYGEPTEEDINYTVLKENGQCLVTKRVGVDPKVIEAREQFETDPRKMDSDTLKKDSRHKWNKAWSGGF